MVSRSKSRSKSRSRSQSRVGKLVKKTRASKVYCGIDPISSKKRQGTAAECAQANQVRLWGVRKIDSKVLKKYGKSKKDKRAKDELQLVIMGLKGQVNGAKKAKESAKTEDERKAAGTKLKNLIEKYNKAVAALKSLQ